MEKFNRVLRGYDPVEVNNFLDKVISQVESMVKELNKKDKEIMELSSLSTENEQLKQKIEQFKRTEETMNKAIMMAQKTSDQMRLAAHNEGETIVSEAKHNANRIVNEALLKAEKTETEAELLRRNINIFKRRLKNIIETQLEVINEIDQVEL